MDIEIKAWLYDTLNAIDEIEGFFNDRPKEFSAYQNDLRTRRAVERNIEIIGEAMNRVLLKGDPITISNSRKIIDTRNRIIHGYDSVSDDIIWGIIVKHLPIGPINLRPARRGRIGAKSRKYFSHIAQMLVENKSP